MEHFPKAHRLSDDSQLAGWIETMSRRPTASNDDAQSFAQAVYALDCCKRIIYSGRQRAQRYFDQLPDGECNVLRRRAILTKYGALTHKDRDLIADVLFWPSTKQDAAFNDEITGSADYLQDEIVL